MASSSTTTMIKTTKVVQQPKSFQTIKLRSASFAIPRRTSLCDLPAEIVYEIFDMLDPIDCTCLGLVSKRFYHVLRRMYGSVPLSCRRNGPNELEWAWHEQLLNRSAAKPGFCRHCGVHRCELHRHLARWIADARLQYCADRDKFVRAPCSDCAEEHYSQDLFGPRQLVACGF
ncbi:F-box domain, Skp2-like protein [Moelleriella libera RCEF 2490]|uniref:F-box domain, Skp2-like protein n=1 Tax=Moelleriella libera RCEF 2490 TaxID=1081109 RepID=A0A167W3F7_9HYPO|nr:F-box domain, Skp2-like protein [Moelleriella libera RCEF 2490]